MVEDEPRVGRTPTPLARMDFQRADFPAASSSASSTPFGSPATGSPYLAEQVPRIRRPSPKSAGSASLPAYPAVGRSESWEREGRGGGLGVGRGGVNRRTSLRRMEMSRVSVSEEEGPFSDPLRSEWGASTSDVSSFPPLSPELDNHRRGSAVSTSSAFSSYSRPHGPSSNRPSDRGGASSINTNRHSLSSFGGYTLNSIGSNPSMPLLAKQQTRESYVGFPSTSTHESSPPPSRDGRPRAHTTSAYSFSQRSISDSSSVHSYPPKPRQRTYSAAGSSENGEGSWAREIERTGATGQIRREKSREQSDAWPAFVTTSYIHQPVARPAATYSSFSKYSFPGPSTRTPPIPSNPLAPLRKRLARSLASTNTTRRLHTEVQLLLELIDALEHCITSFSPPSANGKHRASGDSNASSTSVPLTPSSAGGRSTSAHSIDPSDAPLSASTSSSTSTNAPSTSTSAAPSRSQQPKSTLVDEVRLLIRELGELVPDAQRCLSSGQYGPLAYPGTSTKVLLQSLEEDPGDAEGRVEWWPRRLAKDCRALLEEAGLPTGTASTVWLLAAQLQQDEEGEAGGAGGGKGMLPGVGPPGRTPGLSGGEEDAGVDRDASRREELLKQGKRRWEEYRDRQTLLEKFEERAV
ncbi:hypothetical protein JCM8547_000883 [Rhodosporidiobolus lusitaniae]